MISVFSHSLDFDPASDVEHFIRQVPAKWTVYLLADSHDKPVQLLCVKNLRLSLSRRLGQIDQAAKRANLREVVRRVYWCRVDSAFEADCVYLAAARDLFPATYRSLTTLRPVWFLHVNPSERFPRYIKTNSLAPRPGVFLGPIEDKHDAANLIQLIEDTFDLCRYYNILTESPHGKACAYKEMNRCPAPCDGTVSLDLYRRSIDASLDAILDSSKTITAQTLLMQQASAELKFEQAARIKSRLDQLSRFSAGAFRYIRPLNDFRFLSLQPGPRLGTAKLFLVTPSQNTEIAALIADPPPDLSQALLSIPTPDPSYSPAENIAIVPRHLLSSSKNPGIFLRLGDLADKSLSQAFRTLARRTPAAEPAEESEGLLRELHS